MPLVDLKDMLRHARAKGFAVGAYDAVDSNFVAAIIEGAEAARAPVIVSFAESHFAHYDFPALVAAAESHAKRARVPVALFLDHGASRESAVEAIRLGVNGVMVDASHLPFDENVAATRSVVGMAHGVGVPVEGELGYVPGVEGVDAERHPGEIRLTSPREAALYVDATGVDFLAVSVGTVHGRLRGEPRLDLDRLAAIAVTVGVPLVIHGGTGLTDEQLRSLVARGVAKINYYTALSDLAAAAASNALADVETGYAAAIDAVRAAVADEVARTCEVFGAAGRADETLAVCRSWRNVEHVILFNWSDEVGDRAAEFEAEGRERLSRLPGVREATVGAAIHADAPYQRAWLIRLASAAAEAAYMKDPAHLDYANRVFRPHAADRIKGDFLRD
ncbi:MAG: class II fructose-bisphosphate aldolase [Rhodocyclaceae bacterium]|jgi:fructose-bisphosphate aldolase class II|nr:class II fructose-bisphosphate aldolase [Rhodocyclaceae bacterium]